MSVEHVETLQLRPMVRRGWPTDSQERATYAVFPPPAVARQPQEIRSIKIGQSHPSQPSNLNGLVCALRRTLPPERGPLTDWAEQCRFVDELCAAIDVLSFSVNDQDEVKELVRLRVELTVSMLPKFVDEARRQQAVTLVAGAVQATLLTNQYETLNWMFVQMSSIELPVEVVAPLLLKTKGLRQRLEAREPFLALVERRLKELNDPEEEDLLSFLR